MNGFSVGVDVGGTKIAYGLFDQQGVLVYRYKTAADPKCTQQQFVESVSTDIHEILQINRLKMKDVEGVVLGMPSYVDFQKGIVVSTPNIANLNKFHAQEAFSKKMPGVKVVVDNDTNLAALAEHRFGAGRGYEHMLYTALSTGVGSGMIINNRLFRGAYGGAGESGHMIITPNQGIDCQCGNRGCFMSYISGSMISRHIVQAINLGEKTCMTDMVERLQDISPIILKEAYIRGDALAERMVDQMGYYTGVYVYNMFISMNFNCFVFGGGLTNMGDMLFDRIRETLDQCNHQAGQEIYLKMAELGNDCGIIGAMELLKMHSR